MGRWGKTSAFAGECILISEDAEGCVPAEGCVTAEESDWRFRGIVERKERERERERERDVEVKIKEWIDEDRERARRSPIYKLSVWGTGHDPHQMQTARHDPS